MSVERTEAELARLRIKTQAELAQNEVIRQMIQRAPMANTSSTGQPRAFGEGPEYRRRPQSRNRREQAEGSYLFATERPEEPDEEDPGQDVIGRPRPNQYNSYLYATYRRTLEIVDGARIWSGWLPGLPYQAQRNRESWKFERQPYTESSSNSLITSSIVPPPADGFIFAYDFHGFATGRVWLPPLIGSDEYTLKWYGTDQTEIDAVDYPAWTMTHPTADGRWFGFSGGYPEFSITPQYRSLTASNNLINRSFSFDYQIQIVATPDGRLPPSSGWRSVSDNSVVVTREFFTTSGTSTLRRIWV